jgi:hypothetical protein
MGHEETTSCQKQETDQGRKPNIEALNKAPNKNKTNKAVAVRSKNNQLSKPIDQLQTFISARQLLGSSNPMPTMHNTRLKYCQTFTLTTQGSPLTTFGTEQSLRLNSLYDPDFSLGGHQPYGYDQLSLFYNRYVVTRALVEVIISDPSEDGLVLGMMVKGAGAAQTVANSTIDEVTERQGCVTKWINDSGSQLVSYTMDLPIHQIVGIPSNNMLLAERYTLGATVAADPAVQAYLSIAAANAKGNTSATLKCQVRISFDCQFYDRRTFAQS